MKRRDMICSLAAAAAFVPVKLQANEKIKIEDCREKAAKLAAMMEELAGGEWKVSFQPDFVMISKKIH